MPIEFSIVFKSIVFVICLIFRRIYCQFQCAFVAQAVNSAVFFDEFLLNDKNGSFINKFHFSSAPLASSTKTLSQRLKTLSVASAISGLFSASLTERRIKAFSVSLISISSPAEIPRLCKTSAGIKTATELSAAFVVLILYILKNTFRFKFYFNLFSSSRTFFMSSHVSRFFEGSRRR